MIHKIEPMHIFKIEILLHTWKITCPAAAPLLTTKLNESELQDNKIKLMS
jgi:hypothetical protein